MKDLYSDINESNSEHWDPASYIRGLVHEIGQGVPNALVPCFKLRRTNSMDLLALPATSAMRLIFMPYKPCIWFIKNQLKL